jgi:8-oxo-dGTP pyrophosphatase MutT (NUDIX family)
MTNVPIRSASTIIILRNLESTPQVLMGQRGSKAAFMPDKFVFPGGAVDDADSNIHLVKPLEKKCHDRLKQENTGPTPETLVVAAIRELWEETGLILNLDDFSGASDELSHLQWVPLNEVRSLNLPFITSIVLGELAGLTSINPPKSVPFFKNNDEESLFLRLNHSQ